MERVQKLLSQAGYGSRRACEVYITEGRVRVNGVVITLGAQADPLKDEIEVDGERLNLRAIKKQYIAFYKPPNVISTNVANYQDDRPTVREMVPIEGHLFTIGRLDADSEGLMVLTNDGDLANELAHPRYEHTKTYAVTVYGKLDKETLTRWQDGIWLDEERSAPCYVDVIETTPETTVLRVIMTEGKKRQIRRVASALGHPVKRLVRTHIGMLELGKLKRGDWMELNKLQLQEMQTSAPELQLIKKRRKILRETGGKPRKSYGDKGASNQRGMNSRPKSEGYRGRESRDGDENGEKRPYRPSGNGEGRPPRRYGNDENRPPRRAGEGDGEKRPYRPSGNGENRPPRRYGN
ncbi:MAG: rRNA pseudouridine synthase, partial [Anaerolineae bacterium]|nr:rRNA pseudouridine synthase [Anaerolineae bacterium]